MRRGTTQRAKETWQRIQFSDLQWQEVLIPHSNPRASLQPPPRPQRIGESPGNMTAYELKLWKRSHPPCPAVLQCVNAAVVSGLVDVHSSNYSLGVLGCVITLALHIKTGR